MVNQLLASQGHASQLHDRLKLVLIDTLPELRDAGTRQVGAIQYYLEQARQIRGVDFPELLTRLHQWIAGAEQLVKQHDVQFEELKSSYDRSYKRIGELIKELGIYMNHIPPFDEPSIQFFDVIFDEGIVLMSEQKVEQYSWLAPAVRRMQAWLEQSEPVIAAAREKYEAFENEHQRVEELLAQTEAELRRSKSEIDSSWVWSQSETQPKIDSLARAFVREKNHWERLRERNWADYNIHQAVATCENLIMFCEGVLRDLAKTMEQIHPRQAQLTDKTESVMLLLEQNGSSLSTSDRIDIRSLVGMARETPDFEFANRLLDYAETIAMKRANVLTRNEITNLIESHQDIQ